MASNREIAENVLSAVGGKDNVTQVTHYMTRLRFNLKDQGIPNDDEVKKITGVLGVARSGGQYQVIIGQNVPKVYAEVCEIGGVAAKAAVEEWRLWATSFPTSLAAASPLSVMLPASSAWLSSGPSGSSWS